MPARPPAYLERPCQVSVPLVHQRRQQLRVLCGQPRHERAQRVVRFEPLHHVSGQRLEDGDTRESAASHQNQPLGGRSMEDWLEHCLRGLGQEGNATSLDKSQQLMTGQELCAIDRHAECTESKGLHVDETRIAT
jgi:hypothetical protein